MDNGEYFINTSLKTEKLNLVSINKYSFKFKTTISAQEYGTSKRIRYFIFCFAK